ncbi:MAG: D-aminoacylase [Bryobacterales bacterium]|nr:D-aminoacylase [Bryobacterales bacterium]
MRAVLTLLTLAACLSAADYQLILRNARVIDGSGNPWFRADIAVNDGKIAAIGRLAGKTAGRDIDARNRVVAPGFIDVHTHVETGVDKVPRGDNYLLDGVTTIVTGNCGGSRVELDEWFRQLDELKLGLNLSTLIGHNSVRAKVMGTANRKATPEEIAQMQLIVETAMKQGAVGFSTGLIYIPGTYSDTAEVVALAKAASKYGGVYASHMRDEGEHVLDAISEAVQVGREAGMPVQISHFKIDNKRLWGGSAKSIDLVERYRREGVDVVVDQYPYDHSSTNLGITLPSWALADGREAILERLRSAETRARIKTEMLARLSQLGHSDYSYATVGSFEQDRTIEGKNISEINRARGREATPANEAETVLDIIEAGMPSMVYHSMGMEDVERILRYPNTAIASDGGIREFGVGVPHPRSYGTNAKVLAEFVRTRKTITLEDAIRRMTSLPARTFGFNDRGLIREGMAADLVVFDPGRVEDKATYQQPHQYTEGFDYVLVNGVLMIDDGKLTEARGGRVLRRNPQ